MPGYEPVVQIEVWAM